MKAIGFPLRVSVTIQEARGGVPMGKMEFGYKTI